MQTKKTILVGAIAATMLLSAGTAEARQGIVRARGQNGAVAAAEGPNGGQAVRGRGVVQNEDGSVTSARGSAYRTASGGTGARGSTTTVDSDGNATRQSRLTASGQNGSADTSSTVSRTADGQWSGGRQTSVTNANTGNSYDGSTTIDPATGKPVHSSTCYDASGASIACPR